MKTTLEFIADLKKKTGLESDYAIAKLLGVTKTTLSSYRNGKSLLGDEIAIKVAEILELEDGYVLACVAAERSKNERVKKAWEYLGGFAAALAVLAVLPFGLDNLSALLPVGDTGSLALIGFTLGQSRPLYIMSNAITPIGRCHFLG